MLADFNKQDDIDMRVYFTANSDFEVMFKSTCAIMDGNKPDFQCWNMSTLAYAQTS